MDNDVRLRIGARIAELRRQKGMTQEQLAEATGYKQSHIGRVESGRYAVRLDTLETIAQALGATVELINE